jgi:hypothetical protein
MYHLVAITKDLASQRAAPRREVIAFGFRHRLDAALAMRRWVARHHPGARHHEASDLWLVEDGERSTCLFVETGEPADARMTAPALAA